MLEEESVPEEAEETEPPTDYSAEIDEDLEGLDELDLSSMENDFGDDTISEF